MVVYSPSISSGVSFTLAHFDVRVALFENITHTAQVDVCVQQLYRVRQTSTNKTYIYVNSPPVYPMPAITEERVQKELDSRDRYLLQVMKLDTWRECPWRPTVCAWCTRVTTSSTRS